MKIKLISLAIAALFLGANVQAEQLDTNSLTADMMTELNDQGVFNGLSDNQIDVVQGFVANELAKFDNLNLSSDSQYFLGGVWNKIKHAAESVAKGIAGVAESTFNAVKNMGEAVFNQATELAKKYGADVMNVVQEVGAKALPIIAEYGEKALPILVEYGKKALPLIIKYGPDLAKLLPLLAA